MEDFRKFLTIFYQFPPYPHVSEFLDPPSGRPHLKNIYYQHSTSWHHDHFCEFLLFIVIGIINDSKNEI